MSVVSFEILRSGFGSPLERPREKNNYENHAGKTKKIYLIYEILVFLEWARVESSSRQINNKAIISSKGQNFL